MIDVSVFRGVELVAAWAGGIVIFVSICLFIWKRSTTSLSQRICTGALFFLMWVMLLAQLVRDRTADDVHMHFVLLCFLLLPGAISVAMMKRPVRADTSDRGEHIT